jgi:hypothetical protein
MVEAMRLRPPLVVAALLLLLGAAAPAAAQGKEDECLHGFTATGLAPTGKPRIRCVDNDPSCDGDPTPGVCLLEVGVCLNRTDPQGRCAPQELEAYEIENVQPDSEPLHDFEFQTLQDLVNNLSIPLNPTDLDECPGTVAMVLPLDVRLRKGGAAFRKFKKTIRATVQGPGARDEDALPLRCLPAPGTSPCDDATSTLDLLERHVFAPTCSRDTCHSGPQSDHTLSLLSGEAHENLVGVEPDNLTPRLAGKLRVDPGNPDNSFLLDKLRGTLLPDEGERMPRTLPKIPAKEIALIEAWIAAGAPATGFVPGLGCQGP